MTNPQGTIKEQISGTIDRVQNNTKLISCSVFLIITALFFVSLKIISANLGSVASYSVLLLLFFVSLLVGAGYYLSRTMSHDTIDRLVEYDDEIDALRISLEKAQTERSRAESKLQHGVFHDAITDLPNRSLFEDRLKVSFARAKRNKNYLFGILFVDIDRFKNVINSLGYSTGDQLIKAIAQRLEVCLRPNDTIARFAGDKFAIILDDIARVSNAVRIVDRIYEQLKLPFTMNDEEVFITVSIGIALSDDQYDWPEDLLRDADTAMHRAKSLGKARHVVFDVAMHHHAVKLLHLDRDLRKALERQEFLIYFQPIISVQDGKIAGFESLLRWRHHERGLVSPAEFIPIAEETGLIIPIGKWILREACRQMRFWQERFPAARNLTVSVNISTKQFTQPGLLNEIRDIMRETRISARCLKLEITESLIMENADSVSKLLEELSGMNIQLLIDDFGTGYSSLGYLNEFPFDALKIDRSFVSRISGKDDKLEIIRAIVGLAHNLKMNVIAEGVETEEQLKALKELKCQFAQGYYFAKPLEKDLATALIEAQYRYEEIGQH